MTIKMADIARGNFSLSIILTKGKNTRASNPAIVSGKNTIAAIFNTAAPIIIHIKTNKRINARFDKTGLERLFMLNSMPQIVKIGNKVLDPGIDYYYIDIRLI